MHHNIVFHYMLTTQARLARVACHEEWMTSLGNDRFGIIDVAQKPWHIRPVTERLQEIDRMRESLGASGYDHNDGRFRDRVIGLYTKLRETWERIIEESLFNKAVQRFRPEILTQNLEAACFDTENDYPVIFEGMKRTSHFSGHDRAEDLPSGLPPIEDIDRDVGELRGFATHARERKRALEKPVGAYERGIEAVLL